MDRRCPRVWVLLCLSMTVTAGCRYQVAPPAKSGGNGQGGPSAVASSPHVAPLPDPTNLLEARRGFQTKLLAPRETPRQPVEPPPPRILQLVRYNSPAGQLGAYLSPDPGDGRRHPALIWCHGGFDGIGGYLWELGSPENDQSVTAFVEAGLVLLCPSWRGENENPGRYEMFYGEVEDLVAALDHLARLPYVDPARIYLAGHSTGGTMALLGAESTGRFRAAFSFGGAPDIAHVVSDGRGYGNTPFDHKSADEARMRSAVQFVPFLQCPTFYFEGERSAYCDDARKMEHLAKQRGKSMRAFIIPGADHFNLLDPVTRLIARKVLQDTGPVCNITFETAEIKQALEQSRK